MMARYLVVFFIGWGFNFALDAKLVARDATSWLQHGWLASFYQAAEAPPAQGKRK